MSTLALVLIGIGVAVLLLIAIIASLPSEFRITRSIWTSATSAEAFRLVNDFHNWATWSPWEKLDPNNQKTFEGSHSGVGAIYRWSGNDKIGEGSNTITEVENDKLIRMKLEFIRPFKQTNSVEFEFSPNNNGTEVTWTMIANQDFKNKVVCRLINMRKILNETFDEGLANLKRVLEDRK